MLRRDGWSGTSALELVGDGHTERDDVRPRFACAVLVRGDITIVTADLVREAPSPVRAVVAWLWVNGRDVSLISAALPPGSIWGRSAKVGQADALMRTVRQERRPTLIGMDRNGPKLKRWDPAATEWWREDPRHFFDENATHGCVDVLDRWHAANPREQERARQERPDGPRAVSYVEQRASPPVQRRYDVIMADDSFRIIDVRYRYRETVDAGSDHGLVEATLALP